MYKKLTHFPCLTASELIFQQERTHSRLTITCQRPDPAGDQLQLIDVLLIYRPEGSHRSILAAVSSHFNQASPVSRVPGAEVSGHLADEANSTTYLTISWANPTSGQDTTYTCLAYGVDKDLTPQTASQRLVVKDEQSSLILVSNPEVIKLGLTKELQILCTVPDHSALNITKIASLEIFKQQNGIKCQFARIKAGSETPVLTGALKASLNGSMDGTKTFLGLTWGNISAADAGQFICEGSGVDARGHPVFFSKNITIASKNPDRQELVGMLFDLYSKASEYEHAQEEKRQVIQQKKQLINELSKTQCRQPNSCDSTLFVPGQHIVSIDPDDGLGPISVLCDGEKRGEIWTVFQKRFNGSVDFYRNFSDYENGFGSLDGEFWLGLKHIRRLLLQNENKNKLRVEFTEMATEVNHTKNYHSFSLGPPPGYKLLAIGFDDLGYGMSFNSGYNFSTPDQGVPRLAVLNRAGWWFNYDSPYVNLNGVWGVKGKRHSVYWSEFRRDRNAILERTQMKFRRNF